MSDELELFWFERVESEQRICLANEFLFVEFYQYDNILSIYVVKPFDRDCKVTVLV
jgi:hypothetical protein